MGSFFQVGYWTGTGPLRVLRPQAGLAYKFDVPGAGRPWAETLTADRATGSNPMTRQRPPTGLHVAWWTVVAVTLVLCRTLAAAHSDVFRPGGPVKTALVHVQLLPAPQGAC